MSAQGDMFDHSRVLPDVVYGPGLFAGGDLTIGRLLGELPLEQRTANMYGKSIPVPRLECWFGSRPYAFGGRVGPPRAFTPLVEALRVQVSRNASYVLPEPVEFDSCFANLYRNGDDAISWHADDDDWIGPVIASVSFGAARRFCMKTKHEPHGKAEWRLGDGDLFVMRAGVQAAWVHSVPREKGVTAPRLNLTFRTTVEVRA